MFYIIHISKMGYINYMIPRGGVHPAHVGGKEHVIVFFLFCQNNRPSVSFLLSHKYFTKICTQGEREDEDIGMYYIDIQVIYLHMFYPYTNTFSLW